MSEAPLREQFAAYAHDAWAGWMAYLFSKSTRHTDGSVTIPAWAVARWQRQMNTAYAGLPDAEKESDQAEADKMLALMAASPAGTEAAGYGARIQLDAPDSRHLVRFRAPDGTPLFEIRRDGAVVLHSTADLDAASQQFWAHLTEYNPLVPEFDRVLAMLEAKDAECQALKRQVAEVEAHLRDVQADLATVRTLVDPAIAVAMQWPVRVGGTITGGLHAALHRLWHAWEHADLPTEADHE